MKETRMPPVHVANLVATDGNTVYGVCSIWRRYVRFKDLFRSVYTDNIAIFVPPLLVVVVLVMEWFKPVNTWDKTISFLKLWQYMLHSMDFPV